jgi:hypothetical protein
LPYLILLIIRLLSFIRYTKFRFSSRNSRRNYSLTLRSADRKSSSYSYSANS